MTTKLKGIPFDANEIILPDGSPGYDNVLYSADFANWMRTYFKNGVLVAGGALISTELEVTQVDDTHVQVNMGNIVVNGRTSFIESPVQLEITKGGSGTELLSRVVIELNLSEAVNCFRLLVLEGGLAESPVAPELTRTEEIYQMSLATVRSDISGIVSIVDDRSTESLCGISQVLIGVRPPLPVTGDEASNIGYDGSISGLVSTNVQNAIDEVSEDIAILETNFNKLVISTDTQITLLASNWVDNMQEVSIPGFTSSMKAPIVDVVATTREDDKQWGKIWKAETGANSLKFYCTEAPTQDIVVNVKVVR